MNKIQTTHYRMFLNTRETMDANSNLWNGVPIILSTKNNYDELIQRIMAQNEKTNPKSKAVTVNKEKALDHLILKAVSLSGVLQAFASFNDDPVLLGQVKLTKSAIKNARETEIEGMINPIISAAHENMSNLADFSVSEEMITEVKTSLDDFKVMIGQSRTIRNQAFAAMTSMDELFDECNSLLKSKLDKLMIRFEETQSEFYNEYKRARTIVD